MIGTTEPAARFSACRRYRFTLSRVVNWLGEGTVTFLMLNPSTADETSNDPTIRRCIGYARSWGYGSLTVCNLSPLRATDPADMLAAGREPPEVERENLEAILGACRVSNLVVAAYGTDGAAEGRASRVLKMLHDAGIQVQCLRKTKDGHPWHPLYLPRDLTPVPL